MPDVRPMLCVPHAGAAAAVYRPWRARLQGTVDVVPIELPGRGARRRDPACSTLPALVDALRESVAETTPEGGDHVLYGHSMGALVACELAREQTAAGRPPALLVVSGRNGPSRVSDGLAMHRRPDAELVALLRSLGGTPAEVLDDPGLLALFLGPLRSDLRIAETADRPVPADPLSCPVLVLQGEDDPVVSAGGVDAWRAETAGACEVSWHPGGHFFVHEPGFVGSTLRARLAAALAATGSGPAR